MNDTIYIDTCVLYIWLIYKLTISGYSSTIFQEELETIADSSITYKDGIVQANITKSIELSYPFDTLHKTPVYLMFGIGRFSLTNR